LLLEVKALDAAADGLRGHCVGKLEAGGGYDDKSLGAWKISYLPEGGL
jgi:hypothetical protein